MWTSHFPSWDTMGGRAAIGKSRLELTEPFAMICRGYFLSIPVKSRLSAVDKGWAFFSCTFYWQIMRWEFEALSLERPSGFFVWLREIQRSPRPAAQVGRTVDCRVTQAQDKKRRPCLVGWIRNGCLSSDGVFDKGVHGRQNLRRR